MKYRLAKLISNILNPFLVSFAVITLLSFKSTPSPSQALKWVLLSVALTVLPVFAVVIYLVRKKKLESIFINPRQQRTRIYLLACACAVVACFLLSYLGAPKLLVAAFVAGLTSVVAFMGINFFWKISVHTAFIAASAAILMLVYGAIGALTLVLLLVVAWTRVELKFHTPAQVAGGALLTPLIVVLVFQLFGLR